MRSTASAADLRLSSNKGRGALPSDTQLDLGARLEAAVKGLARHEKSLLRYADTLKRAHERLKVVCGLVQQGVAECRAPAPELLAHAAEWERLAGAFEPFMKAMVQDDGVSQLCRLVQQVCPALIRWTPGRACAQLPGRHVLNFPSASNFSRRSWRGTSRTRRASAATRTARRAGRSASAPARRSPSSATIAFSAVLSPPAPPPRLHKSLLPLHASPVAYQRKRVPSRAVFLSNPPSSAPRLGAIPLSRLGAIPLSRFLPPAPDSPSHRADARRALAGEMATVGQLLVAQQDGPLPPDLEQRFRVGTWFAPPPRGLSGHAATRTPD